MLIDIKPEEIKALDELFKKGDCLNVMTGTILGLFRMRIQEGINAELKKQQKEKAKEILGVKEKD